MDLVDLIPVHLETEGKKDYYLVATFAITVNAYTKVTISTEKTSF